MINRGSILAEMAREKLKKIAQETDRRLETCWKEIMAREIGFEKSQEDLVSRVLVHAKEHNLRSAKRVRASFVYYGYFLGGGTPDSEVWKVMEGVEMVQTALLMHDDFMDRDRLRRGFPTTQEYFSEGDSHYGNSMAVCVGDVVLCLGYERVLSCNLDKKRVLQIGRVLMREIGLTALGQIYDISLPKLGELTEEKVLAIHKTKTALYTFQNPLMMGAMLAGLDKKVIDGLKEYAIRGGVAFQIQDDVLGMFGEVEKTGKSIDSDLLQGKSTLLAAKVLEMGNERQKTAFLKAWGNEKATKEQISEAKKSVIESGSLEYSVALAKKLAGEAILEAKKLSAFKVNNKAVGYLEGVAEYLVRREA